MYELGRVHILEAFYELVYDVLFVDWLQNICANNSVQISLHEIKDKVNVSIIFSLENIAKSHNIGVTGELLQVLNFTVGSLGICSITKGIKTFLES